MLRPAEQTLFVRLAVFVGGLDAGGGGGCLRRWRGLKLGVLDGLQSLVDKSLVRQTEAAGEPRFTMLETIREYALERLQAHAEAAFVRSRHLRYCQALAEAAEPGLHSSAQVAWLDRLEAEHPNLRAALRGRWRAASMGGRAAAGRGTAGVLASAQPLPRGLSVAPTAARRGANAAPAPRARALVAAAQLAYLNSDLGRDCALAEAGVALSREVGKARDRLGRSPQQPSAPPAAARISWHVCTRRSKR